MQSDFGFHIMKRSPMIATAAAVSLGLLVGARHAFEPDHLAAVSTLVTTSRDPRSAATLGLLWGVGHTIALLAVGIALVALDGVPARARRRVFELVVAAMLVVLGAARSCAAFATSTATPAVTATAASSTSHAGADDTFTSAPRARVAAARRSASCTASPAAARSPRSHSPSCRRRRARRSTWSCSAPARSAAWRSRPALAGVALQHVARGATTRGSAGSRQARCRARRRPVVAGLIAWDPAQVLRGAESSIGKLC